MVKECEKCHAEIKPGAPWMTVRFDSHNTPPIDIQIKVDICIKCSNLLSPLFDSISEEQLDVEIKKSQRVFGKTTFNQFIKEVARRLP